MNRGEVDKVGKWCLTSCRFDLEVPIAECTQISSCRVPKVYNLFAFHSIDRNGVRRGGQVQGWTRTVTDVHLYELFQRTRWPSPSPGNDAQTRDFCFVDALRLDPEPRCIVRWQIRHYRIILTAKIRPMAGFDADTAPNAEQASHPDFCQIMLEESRTGGQLAPEQEHKEAPSC